jgi:hypothetical protein
MPSRKRGGQPGNTNAVTHGRYSAATRARRRAEFEAMREREQAWMAKMPPFPSLQWGRQRHPHGKCR